MIKETKHEPWVDLVKCVACILVVLGHFFQSMVSAEILVKTDIYVWFIATIYSFHVPLFFLCSGYLYQRTACVQSISSWRKNVIKKAIYLGIPYFTFSCITWVLKTVFSGSVNNQIGGLIDTLFVEPTSPYWYLYILFFIFAITPTFQSEKKAVVVTAWSLVMKGLVICYGEDAFTYIAAKLMAHEIWFVFGMSISVFNITKIGKSKQMLFQGIVFAVAFLVTSVYVFLEDKETNGSLFLMGLLGCGATVAFAVFMLRNSRKIKGLDCLSQYTMPIFLMHTIFAASFRSVLLKIGIINPGLHIVVGLAASFICPIIAAKIMKKMKLDFLMYPAKCIKL